MMDTEQKLADAEKEILRLKRRIADLEQALLVEKGWVQKYRDQYCRAVSETGLQ